MSRATAEAPLFDFAEQNARVSEGGYHQPGPRLRGPARWRLLTVSVVFAVAFAVERRGATGWLRSPLVYTLSLSVYCTAWTFYGAVGYAARSGLEFLTIYLGPTLVFVGWWWVLQRRVWVTQRRHQVRWGC